MKNAIGFIGLGNVGSKLAGSLMRNDFEQHVRDINLKNASLKNPIKLSQDWTIVDELSLDKDQLIIAEKGVECLQES